MLRLKEGWPRCDKTGWLSKQAYDSDDWKRVWVVLKGCLLLLFEDATEVRPLEVMNVQQASVSELSLQDAWRAEFSRHSKGLLIKLSEAASPPEEVEHLLVPAVRRSSGHSCSQELLVAGSDGLEHTLWHKAFHKATGSQLPEDGYIPLLESTAYALPLTNGKTFKDRPVPATAHLVEQAGAKAAAALAMQQVLVEARELIRSSLLQVASARDEAVSAQRVLYRLTRHLFELDLSLRCCSLGSAKEQHTAEAVRAWLAHARTMVGIVDSAVAGILLQQGTGASLGAAWGVTARIAALHLGDLFQDLMAQQLKDEGELQAAGPGRPHRRVCPHSRLPYSQHWKQKPTL